jgi:hypothetical protein
MRTYWTRIQNGMVSTDVRRRTDEGLPVGVEVPALCLRLLRSRAEAKREEAVSG